MRGAVVQTLSEMANDEVVALPPDSSSALISALWERVGSGHEDFAGIVDALTAAGGGWGADRQ